MAEKEYTVVGVDKHVYYGICDTPAAVDTKDVYIENPTIYMSDDEHFLDISVGDQLIVTFINGNTSSAPSLSLHIADGDEEITFPTSTLHIVDNNEDISFPTNTGRIVIDSRVNIDVSYLWEAGDIVPFIYTISLEEAYWKVNAIGHATINRYGTVRIVSSKEDIQEADDYTAVGYGLMDDLFDEEKDKYKLRWIPNVVDNNWGDLSLIYNSNPEEILSTVHISKLIHNTGELMNNGDGSEPTNPYQKYLMNTEDLTLLNLGDGLGYKKGNESIVNFIPYNDNTGSVKVGYGSLLEYQSNLDDSTDPTLYLDGKQTYLRADNSGFIKLGTVQLTPKPETFIEYANFGSDKITFSKPLTVPTATVNTLNIGEINGNNTSSIYANTITSPNLKMRISGEDVPIKTYIDNNLPPVNVTLGFKTDTDWSYYGPSTDWIRPNANFIFRKVRTREYLMKGGSNISGQNHPSERLPQIKGYVPVGVVGWNVDRPDNNTTWNSGLITVWEIFIIYDDIINNPELAQVVFAMHNHNPYDVKMRLVIDILYVKEKWRE
jgi:hypothetical protein